MAKLGKWQRAILQSLAMHSPQQAGALGAGHGDMTTKTDRFLCRRALMQLEKRKLIEWWPRQGYMLTAQGIDHISHDPWFTAKATK